MGYSEDRSNLQACLEPAHRIRSLRRRPRSGVTTETTIDPLIAPTDMTTDMIADIAVDAAPSRSSATTVRSAGSAVATNSIGWRSQERRAERIGSYPLRPPQLAASFISRMSPCWPFSEVPRWLIESPGVEVKRSLRLRVPTSEFDPKRALPLGRPRMSAARISRRLR